MMNRPGSLSTTTVVSIDQSKRARTTPDPDERMKPDGLGGGASLHANPYRNGGGRGFVGMDGALPAEDAPLVDDQRTDHDVAEHFAGGQDLEAARGVHVALDRPADHDIAPADIALDPAVLADRQVTFGSQVAVHFAVEADVGRGLQPALELDLVTQHGLSNDGSGFARGSLVEHGNLLASC